MESNLEHEFQHSSASGYHAMPRSYCCRYRESDLDLVRRILTEEGLLCWRFEQTDEGVETVPFADSSQPSAMPERSHTIKFILEKDTYDDRLDHTRQIA
jgi:uncharacterized protein involved in type VI secretion and phage assembly